MAQKIQFICTIVHSPDILILDEPLSGFDPINARRIIGVIRDLAAGGTSILLSTHDMPSVERLCDHVVLVNSGRVVLSGPADELRETGWNGGQEVVFKGTDLAFANALGTLAHLDGAEPTVNEGVRKAAIRLREGTTPGAVLSALQGQVEVHEFIRLRPTMETLFIDAVERSAAAVTTEQPAS